MTGCTCHVHSPVKSASAPYYEHTCQACGGTKSCRRCTSLRANHSAYWGFSMGPREPRGV